MPTVLLMGDGAGADRQVVVSAADFVLQNCHTIELTVPRYVVVVSGSWGILLLSDCFSAFYSCAFAARHLIATSFVSQHLQLPYSALDAVMKHADC
jgi:hypothetical protein